jgi:hypothetical protein
MIIAGRNDGVTYNYDSVDVNLCKLLDYCRLHNMTVILASGRKGWSGSPKLDLTTLEGDGQNVPR